MFRRVLLTALPALLLLAACSPKGAGRTTGAEGAEGAEETAGANSVPVGREVVVTDSLLRCGGSDTLRFGRLHEGERARLQLRLKNGCGNPMVVLQHELTCGCILLDYRRQPVMPGDALAVTVDFDTRGLYGWQLKLFRLRLNGMAEPLRIYVEADVLSSAK